MRPVYTVSSGRISRLLERSRGSIAVVETIRLVCFFQDCIIYACTLYHLSLVLFLGGALAAAEADVTAAAFAARTHPRLPLEEPYAFQKTLAGRVEPLRRDPAARPGPDLCCGKPPRSSADGWPRA